MPEIPCEAVDTWACCPDEMRFSPALEASLGPKSFAVRQGFETSASQHIKNHSSTVSTLYIMLEGVFLHRSIIAAYDSGVVRVSYAAS